MGHRSSRGALPLYLLPWLSLTGVAGRIVLETLATMYRRTIYLLRYLASPSTNIVDIA